MMLDSLQQVTFTRKNSLLLAALLLASLVGSMLSPQPFTGFSYLPGSIAVFMVVRLYGMRWGLVAGLASSCWTFILFGHPYAMIWLALEPVFVGYLLKRSKTRNLILFDALYWPLIGAPLIWIICQYVLHMTIPGTVMSLLTNWVTGITNALIASLLINYIPYFIRSDQNSEHYTIPIHHLVFNLLMAIVVIPASIIMVMHGRNTENNILHDLYDTIGDSSRTAMYEIRLTLQKRMDPLPEREKQIQVAELRDTLTAARTKPFHHISLVNGKRLIIASSSAALVPMTPYEWCRNGTIRTPDSNSGIMHCTPLASSLLPSRNHDQLASYLLKEPVGSNSSWSIAVETPFAPYRNAMIEDHIQSLLVLLILNILTLSISLVTSRRLATPIRQLSLVTTDLHERLLREKISEWPSSSIAEIDQLICNFKNMATVLNQKFREITYANETLELRVNERTKELSRTNDDLQKEIAERRATERQRDHLTTELVNQLHFLQTLIDAIPNPIFYKDATGIYQGCNRTCEECLGLTRDEVIGKSIWELYPPEEAKVFHASDLELFARRGVQVCEVPMQFADGAQHSVIIYKATYDDASGKLAGVVGTIIDISPRKKAEMDRDRLMVELQQKNKELEGIVYVASHDLRSPLINVQGFSRKLAKNCAEIGRLLSEDQRNGSGEAKLATLLNESIPRSLGFIIGSIEKMDSLLNGLLRLSRLGRASFCIETLDMQAILKKIVSSMTYQIESVKGVVEIGHICDCRGDAVQVTQVFSNLLDNALKYCSPERVPVIRIYGEEFEDGARYCVEDNGLGIPQEQQENIWEIFHRLNPDKTMGEGLGLTIARRIVDRLRGSIWVESEAGAGSRFHVILPGPDKTAITPAQHTG